MPRVSRGCANCRARKIRCDQQRPRCGQCIQIRKECPGYRDEWELVFRDQTDRTVKRSKKENQKSTLTQINPVPFHSSGAGYHVRPEVHKLGFHLLQTQTPQDITSRPMMRDQIVSFYCSDFFPRTMRSGDIDLSRFVFSGIFARPQKSKMLEISCSALACVFLGKMRHDQRLLQYGVRLYNNAIGYLVRAMNQNHHDSYNEDIVYTCVVFQQVQIHHAPDSINEWLSHIDGLSAILKHYSPKMTTTPLLAAIFGGHQKFRVALTGFMYLSDETIAWLKEPNKGDTLSRYLEILAETSRITTAVGSTDVTDKHACTFLLSECLALEKDHIEFLAQINPDSINGKEMPTYARGELNKGITCTDDLFGPAYRFQSLNDAILHTLLWISLSFVHPLLHQCRHLAMTSLSNTSPPDGSQEEAQRLSMIYVSKAIRCLPYCAQDGMNPWGVYYGLLVACQASRVYTLAKDRDRFIWAQDVFVFLERSGIGIAARFYDIWWNYWFETHNHDTYKVLDLRSPFKKQEPSLYEVTE